MITKHGKNNVVSFHRSTVSFVKNGFNPRITKQNHVPTPQTNPTIYLLDPDGNVLYDPDGNPLYAGDGT